MNHHEETDRRTRALLADAPPQNWETARRRLAAVRRYLEGGERSAKVVDAYAAEIGIGRSLFYRLARIYAEEGSVLEGHPQEDVEPDSAEQLTMQAMERAGTAASQAQIFRSVTEICDERGRDVPSRRLVRACCAKLLPVGRSPAGWV
jgi:transposase-like protein